MVDDIKDVVSVIIPVYKAERYLHECIDSIIGQTYKNLEIILVDDGSPDKSGKICDEYALKDSRIKVIHKENGGVSSARNVGMELATGKWLYFMDSDDWLEVETFDVLLKKANVTGADMVLFDYVRVYSKFKTYHKSIKGKKNVDFYSQLKNADAFKAYSQATTVCFLIVKSECVKNKIKFDTNLKNAEDRLFRLECYQYIKSFAYVPRFFYNYRNNPVSASNVRIDDIRLHADVLFEKTTEVFNKGNYFEDCLIVRNLHYINSLNSVIVFAFENKSINYKNRKKYIFEFINSKNFAEALKSYNKEELGGMVKLLFSFKKITMFKIYCSYYLRKVFRFLRAIKGSLYLLCSE